MLPCDATSVRIRQTSRSALHRDTRNGELGYSTIGRCAVDGAILLQLYGGGPACADAPPAAADRRTPRRCRHLSRWWQGERDLVRSSTAHANSAAQPHRARSADITRSLEHGRTEREGGSCDRRGARTGRSDLQNIGGSGGADRGG